MTEGLCECGCGERTRLAPSTDPRRSWVKGKPLRFILGHVARTRIRKHRRYTSVRSGSDDSKYEHRLIAERVLGKPLPSGVQVHHVDENKSNNSHRNLVICQDQEYHGLLHRRARVLRAGGNPNTQAICSKCKSLRAFSDFCESRQRGHGRSHVCRACKRAYDLSYRKSKVSECHA